MRNINMNHTNVGNMRFEGVTSLGRAIVTEGFFLALAAVAVSGTPKKAPQQSQASGPELSVEGDWVRTDLNGVGSFDGLGNPLPKPELTPAGRAMASARGGFGGRGGPAANDTTPHAAGDPYIVVARPCGNGVGNGAGSFNPDSGGFHLIVGKNQVIFAQERGGSRIIYMDDRPQPANVASWQRAAGHSVGHFENGVLVVDTVGLAGGFGAPRTPETHLTERFEVSPDGKHMKIEYTYTDPKLYVKPYTYAYTFDRVSQKPSYAFEEWCDAGDPIEGQSIVPPKQQ